MSDRVSIKKRDDGGGSSSPSMLTGKVTAEFYEPGEKRYKKAKDISHKQLSGIATQRLEGRNVLRAEMAHTYTLKRESLKTYRSKRVSNYVPSQYITVQLLDLSLIIFWMHLLLKNQRLKM